MKDEANALSGWTPEQIALGRRWVETWERAVAEGENGLGLHSGTSPIARGIVEGESREPR
jgi:hypothetical protein